MGRHSTCDNLYRIGYKIYRTVKTPLYGTSDNLSFIYPFRDKSARNSFIAFTGLSKLMHPQIAYIMNQSQASLGTLFYSVHSS